MSEGGFAEVETDAATIRRRFSELGIMAELGRGELDLVIIRDALALPERGQPPGTRSQMVRYFRGVQQVAIMHQYVLPDGSIGAGGTPDPKWLLDGDTILKIRYSES